MVRHGYCVKKDEIIQDRKVSDYCLTAGTNKAVCKNFAVRENSSQGIKIVKLKLS